MADSSPPTPILAAEEWGRITRPNNRARFVDAIVADANRVRDAVAVLTEERDAAQRAAAVEHDAFDALARKTRRLVAEVAALEAGLRRYAQHRIGCAFVVGEWIGPDGNYVPAECDCGLADLLGGVPAAAPERTVTRDEAVAAGRPDWVGMPFPPNVCPTCGSTDRFTFGPECVDMLYGTAGRSDAWHGGETPE